MIPPVERPPDGPRRFPRLPLAGWRIPASLRSKLLIALGLILLPSLVLVMAADASDLALRREAIVASNRTTAETVASLVDSSIDDAVSVGLTIATEPATRSFNTQILDARLRLLKPELLQFDNIAVVNARGVSVGEMVEYPAGMLRVDVSDRPYFQQTMATNSVQVSPILVSRRVNRPTAIVSVPVRDVSGRAIGAVLVSLNLDYFRAKLWSVGLREDQVIMITDPIGQLAFASNQWQVRTSVVSLANAPLISQAIHGVPATEESVSFPGLTGPQIGAAVPSSRYFWVAAVLEPVAVAEAPVNRVILIDVASFVLALIIGTLATLYLAQQIISPILALDRAAREWSAGNLGVRVVIRSGDELERLAISLDDMAASLSATLEQLSEADRRLTRERNRLRGILETSPAGIMMIDDAETVVIANTAAQAFFGEAIAPGTAFAQLPVIRQIFKPDGTPYSYAELPIIRALRENAPIVGSEILVRRPNGWDVHLLLNAAPVHQDSTQVIGSVAVFLDITPLVEEERLRREFVVSAAHEFRHPLTVIKGYAEVAMRNPTVQQTAVCRELGMIIDAADRANHLANELLRSAQIHLPPVIVHHERINLPELVRETVAQFERGVPQGKYHISVETVPAEVEADPRLLEEALVDLLRQAAEAMPTGGAIDVRLDAWDGIVTVSVTDHGPQVPAEAIPFLFRPFGGVPSPVTEAAVSRPSLPLYLARRIIEESGGWIRASSTPSGTTISFSLPRGIPAARVESNGHVEPSQQPIEKTEPNNSGQGGT